MTLKQLLLQRKGKFALYFLGVLLASTTNIIFAFGMSNAFGVLEAQTTQEIITIFLVSLFLMVLPALIQLVSRMLRIGFMSDVLKKVRLMAYDKILNQDIEGFQTKAKQDYQASLISDITLFENDFFLSLLNLGFSGFSSLFTFIILLRYSWIIALVSALTSILQFVIARIYEKRVREARKNTQVENKAFNNVSSNLVSGFRSLKNFQSEARFQDKFNQELNQLETVKAEYFHLNKQQEVLSQGLATIATLINFFVACYLMYLGEIQIADVVVVINLSSSLIWVMISAIAFVNRIKASIDIYHSLVDQKSNHALKREQLDAYGLRIQNLAYRYGETKVLEGISFELKENQKVLIHGPSGTGKTTLLNCIAQNLSGFEGGIYYGDKALETIHHRDFLDKSAYVRQSHFMFEESIRSNIVMNRPYDEAKLKSILQKLCLDEWIETLEAKVDHKLEANGSNISGGQRQRISLARELYSESDIIFIDEPSASLDDETAQSVYDTILALEKTVICVSHRHLDYLNDKFDQVIRLQEVVA